MLKPLPASHWNFAAAAHLLNRAGFGGTPREIETLLKLGPDQAVNRLVDFEQVPDATENPVWAQPDPERAERLRANRELAQKARNGTPEQRQELEKQRREMQRQQNRTEQERMLELRHWWLKRMQSGPRPLQEKLTLFWHGHFATSAQKVRSAYLMWLQNDTFRKNAAGNWLELLVAVTQDPAMLIWLDQAQSRRNHPNENYAREVMELFTLGEGHYSETDVLEAARAFTGLGLDRVRETSTYRPLQHDPGTKTVLGRTGRLGWREVLETIVRQPQAGRFIATKLWSFFAADNPSPALIDALAAEFTRAQYEFRPFLRRLFRAEEFYAPAVVRNQVKSPTQWLVGSVRTLERELPPPSLSVGLLRQLGQDLFAPPNVKGWDGGISWITTNNLIQRYNQGAWLVMGREALPLVADKDRRNRLQARLNRTPARTAPVQVQTLFSEGERQQRDELLIALGKRFFQGTLPPKLADALKVKLPARGEFPERDLREAIRTVLCTPEYQLT